VKLTTDGETDFAACRAQLDVLLGAIQDRVGEFGVSEFTNSGGKSQCWAGLAVTTLEAQLREQAIEEGVQGFIEAYSGEADRRLAELALEEPAD
jgi:hypothetical protein